MYLCSQLYHLTSYMFTAVPPNVPMFTAVPPNISKCSQLFRYMYLMFLVVFFPPVHKHAVVLILFFFLFMRALCRIYVLIPIVINLNCLRMVITVLWYWYLHILPHKCWTETSRIVVCCETTWWLSSTMALYWEYWHIICVHAWVWV